MNILLVEPFFTGSHGAWAEGYAAHSRHRVDILKLSGSHWKWRMHGGAVTLARRFLESDLSPDFILATDMLDLTTFLALTRGRTARMPAAVYFHENQLTYPWSPKDRDRFDNRDRHYSFINYVSALAASAVFFNSAYHREAFLGDLPGLLKQFPDHQETSLVASIRSKSEVLPLGLDLESLENARDRAQRALTDTPDRPPLILWNHRWEHDKNPEEFFKLLDILTARRLDFRVAILGENTDVTPEVIRRARGRLGTRVVQLGYAEDRATYAEWLWRADILPVTSHHDFFGASVMEAIYCGCLPILPNRLVYPELVPANLHESILYDDFDTMVARLVKAVREIHLTRNITFQPVAAPYDWRRMAAVYDDAMETLVGPGANPRVD